MWLTTSIILCGSVQKASGQLLFWSLLQWKAWSMFLTCRICRKKGTNNYITLYFLKDLFFLCSYLEPGKWPLISVFYDNNCQKDFLKNSTLVYQKRCSLFIYMYILDKGISRNIVTLQHNCQKNIYGRSIFVINFVIL